MKKWARILTWQTYIPKNIHAFWLLYDGLDKNFYQGHIIYACMAP